MYTTISETVDAYNDMLDMSMDIGDAGQYATAWEIVAKCDPIAYKCGWIDWCDAEGIDTDELEDDYTFERDRWS